QQKMAGTWDEPGGRRARMAVCTSGASVGQAATRRCSPGSACTPSARSCAERFENDCGQDAEGSWGAVVAYDEKSTIVGEFADDLGMLGRDEACLIGCQRTGQERGKGYLRDNLSVGALCHSSWTVIPHKDMQDHTVVACVEVVTVSSPSGGSAVDFHIPPVA